MSRNKPPSFVIRVFENDMTGTWDMSPEFVNDLREIYNVDADLLYQALNNNNPTRRSVAIVKKE